MLVVNSINIVLASEVIHWNTELSRDQRC